MKPTSTHVALAIAAIALVPELLEARQPPALRASEAIEARIWLDRGVNPVFQPGDRTRVYYRASHDAYVVMLHVDTDGLVRLLYPSRPEDVSAVRGGRDYRLLFPESTDWVVEESPGVGYFFVLASPQPFELDRLLRSPQVEQWDLALSGVRIEQDAHAAIDGLAAILLPEGASDRFALDFTAYHVGQAYSYPRFLCYQCHTVEPFDSWNPYQQACTDFRVVIYNDPYYYPANRYRGNRVVFTRPPQPGLPHFSFHERRPGEPGTPLVQRRLEADPRTADAGQAGTPEQEGDALRRLGEALLPALPGRPPAADATASSRPPLPAVLSPADPPEDRPILQRRTQP